ncbi:Hypothetical predicted protein [Pelobates cultripes]|uniref:Uncharacterized protein n=1 Tax=Pelobates cultripes TaxID=61616 RepID=A0AAD1VYK2_PELCU|nr:Hypothetical predicted protein [Pelobates cultripes]
MTTVTPVDEAPPHVTRNCHSQTQQAPATKRLTLDEIFERFGAKLLDRKGQAINLQVPPTGAKDGSKRRPGKPLEGPNLSPSSTHNSSSPPRLEAKRNPTRKYQPHIGRAKGRPHRQNVIHPQNGRPWTSTDSRVMQTGTGYHTTLGLEGRPAFTLLECSPMRTEHTSTQRRL